MVDDSENFKQLTQDQTHIWSQTLGFIDSESLNCAVQLGIPDALHNHGKPITLSELVTTLQTKPEKAHGLKSVLRVLVHSGFISQSDVSDGNQQEVKYTLTSASRILLKDEKYNVRALLALLLDPIIIKPWHVLSDWFHNNDVNAFNTAHGEWMYEMCSKDPVLKNTFHEVMENESGLVAEVMIRECRDVFGGLTSLVDVGGGTGTASKVIAQAFPSLNCTVFDLPHVIATLQGSRNLSFVAGDMFDAIPPANAILLKCVLHNWSDEECIKILKNCKEAIPSKDGGGKVIIIDILMDSQKSTHDEYDDPTYKAKLVSDMLMLVEQNGKERNLKEWELLFTGAGFSHYNIVTNKLGPKSLIEVYP